MSYVIGEIKQLQFEDEIVYRVVILLDQVEVGSKILFVNPEDTSATAFYLVISYTAKPKRLVATIPFSKLPPA